MAWNEPGGSDNKDPWGGGRKDQGPPDLDELIKKWQSKINALFGGKKTSDNGGNGATPSSGGASTSAFAIVAVVALIVWGLSGIYIVEPPERGVVTQFGQYKETTEPGPHWHFPYPIENVEIVNVDQNRSTEIGYRSSTGREAGSVPQESLMLTQDENIVEIKFAVQYRIKNAQNYLFDVRDPEATLRQATESAIREAVGKSKMDFVLTQGQSEIADRTRAILQDTLDKYSTGLAITSVNMQSVQPPQEVRGAFEDAIKAREDQQRLINDAEAYSNDVIPRSRGNGARIIEESTGYRESIIAKAEGESSRFNQLLTEYKKAPEVTRQRLYIETMESVLQRTSKVMIDVEGGNNLLYLPLDRMIGAQASNISTSSSILSPSVPRVQPETVLRGNPQNDRSPRSNLRSREVR